MLVSAAALLLWVVQPNALWTGTALVAAGTANLWRLARWNGWAARADRLVLVLHVGFLLTAVGFLFTGASSLWPDRMLQSAALHVWAVGGIGTMTLAVMRGDTLDFLTDCRDNPNHDSFQWRVTIRQAESAEGATIAEWKSERDFHGPQPEPLSAWHRLAQTLMLTNEFLFLD